MQDVPVYWVLLATISDVASQYELPVVVAITYLLLCTLHSRFRTTACQEQEFIHAS